MNIRPLEERDLQTIRYLHARYFHDEFAFPDFNDNFICKFVVENDSGIVSAGGVRLIAESVMVTDQDITAREKRDILLHALEVSKYMSSRNKFNQLHVFAQGTIWNNILRKVGFRDCKGNALVIDCG
jgi:NAD-dependent oxidoreductase involved in siderophore biosynthesis